MSFLIHLWVPGLFDFKGGIQVYSKFLLDGLQAVLPDAEIHVFSMHDRTLPERKIRKERITYHTVGLLPLRLRIPAFTAMALQAGMRQRPDLVLTTHVHFTPVAQLLKQWWGISYWAIAHGFESWDVRKIAVQHGMKQADKLLAVSRFTRDRIAPSCRATDMNILPNTFDEKRFQVNTPPIHLLQRYGLSENQPIILTVNRLAAGETFHSYDQILAALPTIRQAIPNVHYLIVGKGDDRARLAQAIADQNLQRCVTLTGFVPDDELPNHYALADVFAMPSKLEGFGIVYLEAMACGKPVLAGLDGAQDALKDGLLGALVDADDVSAIAQTLIQILSGTYPNPLLYQPHALRKAAFEHFGQKAFQQALTTHLQSVSLLASHFA